MRLANLLPFRRLLPVIFCLLAAQAPPLAAVTLSKQTLQGFERYVAVTQARIGREIAHPKGFLYIDELGAARRSQIESTLSSGGIFIEPLVTSDDAGRPIVAPGGMIHHWIGDVFIPGTTLRQVLDFCQDYNQHKDYYPEILQSRLISHSGEDFKVFYRMRKHKVITVTLDTDHDVRYARLDAAHWSSRSVSTRISQVADAGLADEHDMPVGQDDGFLWRINSYWRFVERNGGVYVECESVSLTRDIPNGLGWLIGPFVSSVPKESLESTLSETRSGVLNLVAERRKLQRVARGTAFVSFVGWRLCVSRLYRKPIRNPQTPQSLWATRLCATCCCGVAWACWSYMLWYHYYDILPRAPQPSIGRIYPINMHGFTKYATRKERRHLDTTENIFFARIAIWLLVGGIFNKDLQGTDKVNKWPSGSSGPP